MSYVERERALPDPQLTRVPAYPKHTAVPATRYAMAGACYTLQAPSGAYVVRDGTSVGLADVPAADAAPLYFKATRLGGYLLHASDGVLASNGGTVEITAEPSPDADWTVVRDGSGRFHFESLGGDGTRRACPARRRTGCGSPPAAARPTPRPTSTSAATRTAA